MNKKDSQVVIRRVKKVVGGGHHGGAWKVAYADFVTAMMAFFLVMWLVGATTNKEKAAISQYFKNPSAVAGHSVEPASGPNGPGGASTSMIKLGGTMEIPRGRSEQAFQGVTQTRLPEATPNGTATKPNSGNNGTGSGSNSSKGNGSGPSEAEVREADHTKLVGLLGELKVAVDKSQALAPYKDQLLLDVSQLGLRLQIVDKQNRAMFDSGSAELKPYTAEILHELAKHLNEVPNKISITGHTDITPYVSSDGYTNWELSTDRANAARRALVAGGLAPDRIALVVGLAAKVPLDRQNPAAPANRRISIVVMSTETEKAEMGEGTPIPIDAAPPTAATAGAATATDTPATVTAADATAAPSADAPAAPAAAGSTAASGAH